jgi:hypothetical protein
MGTPVGRVLLRTLVGAAAFLVVVLVARQARAQAYRLKPYRLTAHSIRFADLPEWADAPILRALGDPRHLRLSVSVFDPAAEDRIREALAAHPMVREVRSVQVQYPDRAIARLRLRTPLARVEVGRPGGGAFEWISDDGHLLDPVPYRGWFRRVRTALPLVVGVRARPPRLGEAWVDREEQVLEALEAARTAGRLWRDLNGRILVSTIDVARFPARPEERAEGEVRFQLADGRVVDWGRTDRDLAEGGEDEYDLKLVRLRAHLDEPALKSSRKIDVRYRMPFEGRDRMQ